MIKTLTMATLVLATAALCACGGNNQNSGSSSSSSASSSSASSSSSSSSSGQGASTAFPPSVTRPKIMIVGDSISAGPGCYKKYLDANLQESGITNYEFVGEYTDDCGGGIRHSAVSCSNTNNYTQTSFTLPNCFQGTTFPGLRQLMTNHNPDMLMVQLGVNDIWGGNTPVQNVLGNYTTLVEQARAHNPNIVVVLAQIHKVITDNCTNEASYQNAQALVEAVPGWAEQNTTVGSPIFVADLWTNSDANDADDCVHPNDTGSQRMAENWYNALVDLLW